MSQVYQNAMNVYTQWVMAAFGYLRLKGSEKAEPDTYTIPATHAQSVIYCYTDSLIEYAPGSYTKTTTSCQI